MRQGWIYALPLAGLLFATGTQAGLSTGYYTDEEHYDVAIPGMLDFDQIRSKDEPDTPGLPNDGLNYCVPTSAMDLFAFLANNGYPDLAPHEGNWSDETDLDAYYEITDNIIDLGNLMNTDPYDGTYTTDWYDGLRAWLAPYSSGTRRLVASAFLSSSGYSTTTDRLAYYATSALVQTAYGYYDGSVSGDTGVLGDRSGGHAQAFYSAANWGGTEASLKLMDPADSTDSAYGQSVMSPRALTTSDVLFADAGATFSYIQDTYAAGSLEVIDKFFLIRAFSLMLVDPSLLSALRVYTPVGLSGSTSESRSVVVPGTIREATLRPDGLFASAVTREASNKPATAWLVDLRSGQSLAILSASTVRLAFSRFLELYVTNGREVQRYDVDRGTPTLAGTTTLSVTPAAMEWIDEVDALWALDAAHGRIVVLSRTLAPLGQLSGDSVFRSLAGDPNVRMAAVPGGRVALLSPQQGVLGLFERVGSGMVLRSRYNGAVGAKDVSATDAGHLILATSGGSLIELASNGLGSLVPVDSNLFQGARTSSVVEALRSRTNFDSDLHSGPGWADR
jgi:hypothetical protein